LKISKAVIRSRKSKEDRQYNGEYKYKRKSAKEQTMIYKTQKPEVWEIRTPQINRR
jgi:hypothetical protein